MILNIRHLMTDLGLTQNDIANIIGEYQSVVSLFVQGKRYPMPRHIEALEGKFGKDIIAKYYADENDIEYTEVGKAGMIELKRLIGDYSLSQKTMAEIMGTTQSEVSQLCNGNRRYMKKHIDALVAHFGKDVIDSYTLPTEPFKPTTHTAEVTILNPEAYEKIKKEVREEMQGDVKVVPFVGKDIATAPNLDVRQIVKEKAHTLEEFPFYKMVKGVDYIQTVITMAMAPRYLPGDYLFIRFRDGNILSGKLYLVDTRPYGTMLRQVHIEEGGYLLKATNPDFKEVFVKTEDVYSISSVVLTVNTNTSLTSEVNLAEMVKNRDQQIKRMVEAQQQMLDAQDELIAEIREQSKRMERIQQRQDALVDKIINKE